MNDNAFFKFTDPKATHIGGVEVPDAWWSRGYEYHWAGQFTGNNLTVAEMGAGWSGRPWKEELADTCEEVYAVDLDPRFLSLPVTRPNLHFVLADFRKKVNLPPLDRVFCISVLEELDDYRDAVKEFYRLLKSDGLLVITCDAQYDMDKPLPKYPGVSFEKLFEALSDAGFIIPLDTSLDKEGAFYIEQWNLACWHGVFAK